MTSAMLPDRLASGPRKALLARLVTLPLSALSGLATTLLVIRQTGVRAYALYALVTTLPTLLPFSDLGVGAAVSNVIASRGYIDQGLTHRVLLTSVRSLVGLGAVIACGGGVLALLGYWPAVLGVDAVGANLSVAIALGLFGASVALGIGAPVLRAAGSNYIVMISQALVSVLTLLLMLAGVVAGLKGVVYLPIPFAAATVGAFALCRLASKREAVPLRALYREALSTASGSSVRRLAGPMAIVNAAIPVGYNTDRLILSHTSGARVVAVYSVAAQLFSQAQSLIGAAGLSLWPVFAHLRASGRLAPRSYVVSLTLRFLAGGIVLAVVLTAAGPALTRWLTAGKATSSVELLACFGVFLIVLAVTYPVGMFLTDESGLKLQALTALTMVTLNLPLSVLLARQLGAVGPVIATFSSVAICMGLPAGLMVRRRTSDSARLDQLPAVVVSRTAEDSRPVETARAEPLIQWEPAVLVTGLIRGGTTWVGKCLAAARGAVYLDEPFNPNNAERMLGARLEHWYVYLDDSSGQELIASIENLQRLRLPLTPRFAQYPAKALPDLGQWMSARFAGTLGSRAIVKDPIALMSAGWLSRQFGWPVVLCMRHPLAFVSSIVRLQWRFDFANWHRQRRLMATLLAPFDHDVAAAVATPPSLVDQAILQWRVMAHVVEDHRRNLPDAIAVRHEVLATRPLTHLAQIFNQLQLSWSPSVENAVHAMTVRGVVGEVSLADHKSVVRVSERTLDTWAERLASEDIRHVRAALEGEAAPYYPPKSWELGWRPFDEQLTWVGALGCS